jgi:hypothetical protein
MFEVIYSKTKPFYTHYAYTGKVFPGLKQTGFVRTIVSENAGVPGATEETGTEEWPWT